MRKGKFQIAIIAPDGSTTLLSTQVMDRTLKAKLQEDVEKIRRSLKPGAQAVLLSVTRSVTEYINRHARMPEGYESLIVR